MSEEKKIQDTINQLTTAIHQLCGMHEAWNESVSDAEKAFEGVLVDEVSVPADPTAVAAAPSTVGAPASSLNRILLDMCDSVNAGIDRHNHARGRLSSIIQRSEL